MDQTAVNEVAQVAHAFTQLRQGARLADLRLPKRLRAAVLAGLAIKKPDLAKYFWN